MEQSFIPHDLDDAQELVNTLENTNEETSRTHSYQETRWSLANNILALTDRLTKGRAGMLQRLFSFLFVGGLGAVVNMVVFNLLYVQLSLPMDARIHNVLALTISYEISVLVNFSLNDYFTFRHLSGHTRSWMARCSRFHLTAIVGYFLTLGIQYVFHFFLHISPTVSQALAILLVTFYNFAVHHLFTYRHVKTEQPAPLALSLEQALDEGARELATAMSGSTDAHRAV
jgi:putative flippase GtrA